MLSLVTLTDSHTHTLTDTFVIKASNETLYELLKYLNVDHLNQIFSGWKTKQNSTQLIPTNLILYIFQVGVSE